MTDKIILRMILIMFSILTITSQSFGQNVPVLSDDPVSEIKKLNSEIRDIRKSNNHLKGVTSMQQKKIDTLQKVFDTQTKKIEDDLQLLKKDTQDRFSDTQHSQKRAIFFWILGLIILFLLIIAVYVSLRKMVKMKTLALDDQLKKTKETLGTEALKLDAKLIEILENRIKTPEQQSYPEKNNENSLDHSLALRVGEEIYRMRKRIENMAQDVKGIGALQNSLMRLEEEFNSNGYEIVNLVGKPYAEGMVADVRFLPSDELKPGQKVISKIIKPQINYKGILVRAAEIEVNVGG